MHYQSHKSIFTSLFAFKIRAKSVYALIALITALAFVALVSTAVTHHHETTQESQDCSICGAVSDKIGTSHVAATVAISTFFVLFTLVVVTPGNIFYPTVSLLPPSCGPPAPVR